MCRALAALALVVGAAGCGDGEGPAATVTAEIAVAPAVGPDIEVAPDGDVWLPASDTFGGAELPDGEAGHVVVRIDPGRERVVATVAVAHPMVARAVGEGGIWVTGTDDGAGDAAPRGSLVRIDPVRNEVAAVVDLGEGSPSDVAVGFGSVWVSDSSAHAVHRVDPATATVVAQIAVEGGPTSLAVTGDAVWVTKPGTGQIRPIDPRTGTPGRPVGAGTDPSVLGAGGAGLFVADYADRHLSRIGRPGRVEGTVSFPSAPSRFDVGEEIVVVAEVEERTLSVVRGGDRQVVLEGRVLVAVALDGPVVWAADPRRGAVLRIALPPSV